MSSPAIQPLKVIGIVDRHWPSRNVVCQQALYYLHDKLFFMLIVAPGSLRLVLMKIFLCFIRW